MAKEKPYSKEEAAKVLEEDRVKRVEDCKHAIDDVLKKHSCAFDIVTVLKSGSYPETVVNIIPRG